MLTILTHKSFTWEYKLKRVKRVLFKQSMYKRGHQAVINSLINGLNQLNIKYILDPVNMHQITEHVHVLSGSETLEKDIELKKKGLSTLVLPKGRFIVLCVGRFSDKQTAQPVLTELKKQYRDCFIRRI